MKTGSYLSLTRFLSSSGSTGCANQWKQVLGTDVVATTRARAANAVEAFLAKSISFFIKNPPFQTVHVDQALSVGKM